MISVLSNNKRMRKQRLYIDTVQNETIKHNRDIDTINGGEREKVC